LESSRSFCRTRLNFGLRGVPISQASETGQRPRELLRLLARVPFIRDACDLDLLVFLYRHPRSLLTSDQIAASIGYDNKRVAKSLDAFIDAGLLQRTQSPMHAARMYLLVLNGPRGGGLPPLLKLATTRQGRRSLIETLNAGRRPGERGSPRKNATR
jgi:hypothetical protein